MQDGIQVYNLEDQTQTTQKHLPNALLAMCPHSYRDASELKECTSQ